MRPASLFLIAAPLLYLAPATAVSQEPTPRAAQVERNDDLRKDALFLLASRRTPESSKFLRDFYRRTNDPELKKSVIFHIAQSGTEEDVRWLKETVADKTADEEIRKNALFWLAQNQHTTMAELEQLYTQTDSREIKEAIIFAYSQRHSTEAADRLMTVARQDPDQKLRKSALFWLAQSEDPRVTQFLVDIVNQ
jgi:HEAT repeat protein